MRKDGHYVVYLIQFRYTEQVMPYYQGWRYPSWDHFPAPPNFSASGDCWQQLGIHGSFDLNDAIAGVYMLAKLWPEYDWRAVEVEMAQKTRPQFALPARTPGKKAPSGDYRVPDEYQECQKRYKEAREIRTRLEAFASSADRAALARNLGDQRPLRRLGKGKPDIVRRASVAGPAKKRLRLGTGKPKSGHRLQRRGR